MDKPSGIDELNEVFSTMKTDVQLGDRLNGRTNFITHFSTTICRKYPERAEDIQKELLALTTTAKVNGKKLGTPINLKANKLEQETRNKSAIQKSAKPVHQSKSATSETRKLKTSKDRVPVEKHQIKIAAFDSKEGIHNMAEMMLSRKPELLPRRPVANMEKDFRKEDESKPIKMENLLSRMEERYPAAPSTSNVDNERNVANGSLGVNTPFELQAFATKLEKEGKYLDAIEYHLRAAVAFVEKGSRIYSKSIVQCWLSANHCIEHMLKQASYTRHTYEHQVLPRLRSFQAILERIEVDSEKWKTLYLTDCHIVISNIQLKFSMGREVIKTVKQGCALMEKVFKSDCTKYGFYGTLQHNRGYAHFGLRELDLAEEYWARSIEAFRQAEDLEGARKNRISTCRALLENCQVIQVGFKLTKNKRDPEALKTLTEGVNRIEARGGIRIDQETLAKVQARGGINVNDLDAIMDIFH